ncbi:MAG TPA: OB-fold domain-containing protein [Pseudonocardiaceae bacterium]|nr:OB-fold domain-containing protein [Pseudonocardiaceae bacterium]
MTETVSTEPTVEYRNPTTAFDTDGHLLLRHCPPCDRWYPSWLDFCSTDLHHELVWRQASGAGRLFSWVTYHKAYDLPRALPVPYTVGLVVLAEGPRAVGRVLDPEVLARDLPVTLVPDREGGHVYPAWRPA